MATKPQIKMGGPGKIKRIEEREPSLRVRPDPDEYDTTNTVKKGTLKNKDARAYSSQPPSKRAFSKMPQVRQRKRSDREA